MMKTDAGMMALALALAGRALGTTWPNPAVGAVVVERDSGAIAGCGATARGGRPHAEVIALRQAGERARGATLYVTLEPCSHWGKSPPCVDAILAAGVSRVVFGAADANPLVAGRGLARLREAGLDVIPGPFAREARWLALGHTLKVTAGRPFVQLKVAIGSDGRVPAGTGRPVWVTGPQARALTHLWRARADAIATGLGSVAADDPELTCRLPGMESRSPVRVIFDSAARLPPGARLFAAIGTAPLWVFRLDLASQDRIAALEARGAQCPPVPSDEGGGISLSAALRLMGERGITRLLVEGGPKLAGSFLRAGLVDEALIFEGAAAAGRGGMTPFAGARLGADFVLFDTRRAGEDRLRIYRRRDHWA